MRARLINRLPIYGSELFLDVQLRPGTLVDAQNWHALVQPDIAKAGRADAQWNWPRLFSYWRMVEEQFGRNVSLYCLDVPGKGGTALPLARMLLSEGYPALDGSHQGSVFLWYLARAPSSTLKQLGYSHGNLAMVVEALLDTAMQRSFELGYDGRLGLHAAPEGGAELYCKYRDNARLKAMGSQASLTRARRLKGGNDLRYFWSDSKLAQSLTNSLDYLR